MKHIFISYCHDDEVYLEELLSSFNSYGLSFWYDKDIELGNKWRKEIRTAIEDSHLVIVILSKNSAKRPYVIFEWAYAMGHGIDVIGIKFDDVDNDNIPDPLAEKQFGVWNTEILGQLMEILKRKSSESNIESNLMAKIEDIAHHTYDKFYILDWFEEYRNNSRETFFAELIDIALIGASRELKQLEELLLSYHSSMPSKLKLHLNKMIDAYKLLTTISNKEDLRYLDTPYFEEHYEFYMKIFTESWLPVYTEYFKKNDIFQTLINAKQPTLDLMFGMLNSAFNEKFSNMDFNELREFFGLDPKPD